MTLYDDFYRPMVASQKAGAEQGEGVVPTAPIPIKSAPVAKKRHPDFRDREREERERLARQIADFRRLDYEKPSYPFGFDGKRRA